MLPKFRSALIIFLAICTLGLGVAPPEVNLAYAAPEDVALFQDVLSTYGQWLNYGQHGPVWRPGQVNRNWRPYTNGRWVPSQEGYVFETDEPWGWATYHYGNWLPTEEHGWVWVPGRTWYPHTVNWRTSDENVGWAPVPPPEYTGSDNYSSGGYSDGGYGCSPDLNSSGSALSPSSWIFTPVRYFLLGWGQPYSSIYSYTNACVLASPQYIPTIYRSTVYVNNYVSPSYAPNACYNWGPPVTYVTKVTNIKNIEIERRCKDLRLAHLRNVVPPANMMHRHPAWREVWPAAAANREIQVRPISHHKIASSRLNRPDAVPAPSSLHRRRAEVSAPNNVTGRPLPPETANHRASSPRTLQAPENLNTRRQPSEPPGATQPGDRPRGPHSSGPTVAGASDRETAGRHAPFLKNSPGPATVPGDQTVRQQTPAAPPRSRYQNHQGYQPIEPTAAQNSLPRRPQTEKQQQDQKYAEPELRLRQQQRLEMERRQQEARTRQIPASQQIRSQPQLPVDQQRRPAEMPSQQQGLQQRQVELQRQQQAQQQSQADIMRQQQIQQQRQAEMQRQQQEQQLQQQHQAELQRQQQAQQQRQAEMMRQQQMQQQRQAEMQRQQQAQQMQQQRQAELQRQQQAQQQHQAEMMRARQMQQQQQVVRQSPPPPPPPQAPPPRQKKPDNQK
jgi:DNA segregation ATPase FtsK/SpoIIIE-like protein